MLGKRRGVEGSTCMFIVDCMIVIRLGFKVLPLLQYGLIGGDHGSRDTRCIEELHRLAGKLGWQDAFRHLQLRLSSMNLLHNFCLLQPNTRLP